LTLNDITDMPWPTRVNFLMDYDHHRERYEAKIERVAADAKRRVQSSPKAGKVSRSSVRSAVKNVAGKRNARK